MRPWSDEQRRLREAVRASHDALSRGHVARDRDAVFSRETWEAVRASGVLRIPFDTRWGGLGHDLLTTMYVLEDLGRGCRDGGVLFSAVTHVVSTGIPLSRFGSPELRERYLPHICDGTAIGAHAITELEGGSDAMNMRTNATEDGDAYVLRGRKAFVTNGPVADLITVYARTDDAAGAFGVTAFLVERTTPGLSVGEPVSTMGLRTSPLCELVLDDCRVPKANIIGKCGAGFALFDYVMKWEILCSFAVAVGKMEHRLDRCIEHARTRVQFGRPIGTFQSISNKIVDMKIGVETSRKWIYDAAELVSDDANAHVDVAIAKLVVSEADLASALAAVQIFGGQGYLTEQGLEKDVREAIAGTIYSGTSEIQRDRIARLLKLPAP